MFFDRKAWLEYRNDSGERIPAFGIVRITGVVVPEPGRVLLTVAKPDAYGCQLQCAVNGPVPIDADRYGVCARGPFVAALYDTGDGTPAVGQKWGPLQAVEEGTSHGVRMIPDGVIGDGW